MLTLILVVPIIRDFFRLAPATWPMIGWAAGTAAVSVLWIEGLKAWRRKQ
jgi:hypothetical protein